jgi:hypothetical protein
MAVPNPPTSPSPRARAHPKKRLRPVNLSSEGPKNKKPKPSSPSFNDLRTSGRSLQGSVTPFPPIPLGPELRNVPHVPSTLSPLSSSHLSAPTTSHDDETVILSFPFIALPVLLLIINHLFSERRIYLARFVVSIIIRKKCQSRLPFLISNPVNISYDLPDCSRDAPTPLKPYTYLSRFGFRTA